MAAVLFAVIYGGSSSSHATLLRFLSTEITVLVYVGRTQGRGNYSIMVHREFCWLGGDQEFITTNLKDRFNKEEECARVAEDAEMCNRFLCVVGNIQHFICSRMQLWSCLGSACLNV